MKKYNLSEIMHKAWKLYRKGVGSFAEALHRETVVLDGGRVSALERLGQSPQSWICKQYTRQGFTVGAVHKGDHLTATVDTDFLWKLAVLDVAAAKAGKAVAQLLEGGVNHAQA